MRLGDVSRGVGVERDQIDGGLETRGESGGDQARTVTSGTCVGGTCGGRAERDWEDARVKARAARADRGERFYIVRRAEIRSAGHFIDGRTPRRGEDGWHPDAGAGWWNCLLGWNWRVAHSGPRVGRVASNQEHPVEGASEPTSQSESAHARARSRIRRRSRVPLTRDSADPMDTEEVSPELRALMATLAKSNMSHDELDKLEAEEAAKAAASEASPEPPLAAPQDPHDQQPPAEQHAEKSPGSDEQTAGNAEPEPPTGPAPTPAEPTAPAPEAPAPEAPTPEAPAPEAPTPEAPTPEAPAPLLCAPPPTKSLLGKSNSVKVGVFSEKLSADAGNKAALQGAHAEIQKEAIQEEIASNPDAASDPAVAEKLAESQKAIDAAEEYREARRNLEAVRETSKQESVLAVDATDAPVAVHLRADPDGNIDVLASDRLTREVLYKTRALDEPVAVAKSADEERPEGADANVPADQRGAHQVPSPDAKVPADQSCADQVPSPDAKVPADQSCADQVPSPDAKVPADQRGADQVPSPDAKVPADQRGADQVPSPDAKVPADQSCADQVPSPDAKVPADQSCADQVPSPDAKVPADQRGADQVPSLDAKVPADQRGVDQVPSPSPREGHRGPAARGERERRVGARARRRSRRGGRSVCVSRHGRRRIRHRPRTSRRRPGRTRARSRLGSAPPADSRRMRWRLCFRVGTLTATGDWTVKSLATSSATP